MNAEETRVALSRGSFVPILFPFLRVLLGHIGGDQTGSSISLYNTPFLLAVWKLLFFISQTR